MTRLESRCGSGALEKKEKKNGCRASLRQLLLPLDKVLFFSLSSVLLFFPPFLFLLFITPLIFVHSFPLPLPSTLNTHLPCLTAQFTPLPVRPFASIILLPSLLQPLVPMSTLLPFTARNKTFSRNEHTTIAARKNGHMEPQYFTHTPLHLLEPPPHILACFFLF